ncbi:MAG: leucine-rich repeat protein [Bacillota bacterium]|nr:leucine-rich repeat protein [Bacillota bacterium]
MKKQLITLLLALCLVVALTPLGALAAEPITGNCGATGDGSSVKYTLTDEDGNGLYELITISGEGAMANYPLDAANGDPTVPWKDHLNTITKVVVENGVTVIGERAFSDNDGSDTDALTTVDLSDCATLTALNEDAFSWNSALTTVILPANNNLTQIGKGVFYNCKKLSAFDFAGCAVLESIGELAFRDCDGLTEVDLSGRITLKTIGKQAFYYCDGITAVDLSGCSKLESIGEQAFYICTSLKTVDLSGCTFLATIGVSAFSQCRSLEIADLSGCSSLTTLYNHAFRECESLEIADFSDCTSLNSIGDNAFISCKKLKVFILGAATPPSLGGSVFYHIQPPATYVPSESIANYKAEWTVGEKYAGEIIAIPFTVTPNDGTNIKTVKPGYAADKAEFPFTVSGTALNAAVTLEDNTNFTASTTAINSQNTAFTVSAKAGLSAGKYRTLVTVTDENANSPFVRSFFVQLNVEFLEPAAADFTFTAPSDLVYNGQPKEAAVAVANGVNGMGEITAVKYYDEAEELLTDPPTEPGTYTVKIDVAEGTNYKAAENVTAETWKFTIEPAEPAAADFTFIAPSDLVYNGQPKEAAVAVANGVNGMGEITAVKYYDEAEELLTDPPTEPGTYTVKIDVAEGTNYKAAENVTAETWKFTIIPTYTLSFETNGGDKIDPVTVPAGEKVDLTKYETKRAEYDFAGWYRDKELKTPVTEIEITDNATVYAKWYWQDPFNDVDTDDWFFDHVVYVAQNGLMIGVSADSFAPEEVTSRAMVVTTLWRLDGEPEPKAGNSFNDVKPGQWYTKAIIWAEENNITEGYGNDKFGVDDPVTREQMVVFFYRYAGFKDADVTEKGSLDSFPDKDRVSSWAVEAMEWAVRAGHIEGDDDSMLNPKDDTKRSEFAAVLHRFSVNLK